MMKVSIYVGFFLMVGLTALKIYGAESPNVSGSRLFVQILNDFCNSAKLHIHEGADVNFRDHLGQSSLMEALLHCDDVELIRMLVDKKADVKATTIYTKTTPFHFLARSKKISAKNFKIIADILLKAGANINEKDVNGDTPLHFAVSEGLVNNARILMSEGADPMIRNNDGKLPMELVPQGNNKMRGLFVELSRKPVKND